MAQADEEENHDWAVSVDSTVVRAHQHAAGVRKRAPAGEPADHAIGRSRGGLTTKIHLAADGRCRPLAFVLTGGQANDAPTFAEVKARLCVPRRREGPAPGRMWSWRTRPIRRARSTSTCAAVVSGRSSRSGRIRTPTAYGEAAGAGALPLSTVTQPEDPHGPAGHPRLHNGRPHRADRYGRGGEEVQEGRRRRDGRFRCSASTSKSPSNGRRHPPGTGPVYAADVSRRVPEDR